MALFIMTPEMQALRAFPTTAWEEEPSSRWMALCNQLHGYQAGPLTLTSISPDRKWELVSAYQKTIRRGIVARAVWLAGGMISLNDPAYIWRRICTTAAEDVGYSDPELMNFVLACSIQYGKKAMPPGVQHRVVEYLTLQMCAARRSRIYCQMSIIEGVKGLETDNTFTLNALLATSLQASQVNALQPRLLWAQKNNWRGEGMVKFQYLNLLDLPTHQNARVQPPSVTLKGLPDYAYDMHTRVGKTVCVNLCGHPHFKPWLKTVNPKNKPNVLGWALFFAEGGLIPGGLEMPLLNDVEDEAVAFKHGITPDQWANLGALMQEAVQEQIINSARMHVLARPEYAHYKGVSDAS